MLERTPEDKKNALTKSTAPTGVRAMLWTLSALPIALFATVRLEAKTLTIAAPGDTVAASHLTAMVAAANRDDVVRGDRVVISGAVNLTADSIHCGLQVIDSQFLGPVQADTARFMRPVNFSGTRFKQVDFRKARFEQSAQFIGATFADTAYFGAHMKSSANFRKARFESVAEMVGLVVDYAAIFIKTHFADEVHLYMSNFKGETIFDDAVIEGPISLTYTVFHSKAKFKRAAFGGRVDLRETSFLRQADFKGARFDDELLIEEMYFTTLYLDGWAQLKDAVRLASNLEVADEWVRRPDQVDDIQATSRLYIQLQEVLRQNGLYGDENNCYYDLKTIEGRYYWRRAGLNPITWGEPLKYTILWATCGYGVRPHYTLYLGCAIVLLCALCYYQRGAICERGVEEVVANYPEARHQRFRDALYFSLNTFTTVGYGDWYPTDNLMKLGKVRLIHFRTIAMLEGLIGWVLITVFVISLGKTWIR